MFSARPPRVVVRRLASPRARGASFVAALLLASGAARAARPGECVSLATLGTPIVLTFDAPAKQWMSAKLPTGAFAVDGSNKPKPPSAGDGASVKGGAYLFGMKGQPERGLGVLRDDKGAPLIGLCFVNDSDNAIGALAVTLNGETWRVGGSGQPDRLDAAFSVDAAGLTSGTWRDVDALDVATAPAALTRPAGPVDGNDVSLRTASAAQIDGISIPRGGTFFLRWSDVDQAGPEDALAIDDLTLNATPAAPAALILAATGTAEGSGATAVVRYAFDVAHAPQSGQGAHAVRVAVTLPPGVRAVDAMLELAEGGASKLLTLAADGDAGALVDGSFVITLPEVPFGGTRSIRIIAPVQPGGDVQPLVALAQLSHDGQGATAFAARACSGGSALVGDACRCPDGTAWAAQETACKALACIGGSVPEGNTCVCPASYHWNSARQECITCVKGTVQQGEDCVCPEGWFWSAEFDECRHCVGGTFYDGQQCVCPQGEFWSNDYNECRRCLGGSFFNGQQCVCPDGSFWSNEANECRQCLGGSFFDGQQCVCPQGSLWNNETARCEAPQCSGGSVPDGAGGCTCTGGRQWQGGVCQCPAGYTDNGSQGCQRAEPPDCGGGRYRDGAGNCQCYSWQEWNGSQCVQRASPPPDPHIDRYQMPSYPSSPFIFKSGSRCKEFLQSTDNKGECQNYCSSLIATRVVQSCVCMEMITHCDGSKDKPVRVP